MYDLPEAIEAELIEWKAPDSDTEIDTARQIARGEAPPTERDTANIIADGSLAPGGLALAEEASTITPWPHQRVVSDTLANTYPNSFLLCDEVGLGKTIEAGLTLSRLGITGEIETGLLLVPASLTIQWQEELWEKFNITAYRFDRGSGAGYAFHDPFGQEHAPPSAATLDLDADERAEAWTESPIWRFLHQQQQSEQTDGPSVIIMSWHTARLDDRWDQVAPRDHGDARIRDDVAASARGRPLAGREGFWDAVIIDEAHNAREGSKFYTLLDRLRDHTQAYYLLTATPMQLHAGELYDLMTLLDLPDEWDQRDQFMEFFETRRALTHAVSDHIEGGKDNSAPWSAQSTLDDQQYQDRLPSERALSDEVFDAIAANLDVPADEQARGIAKQRVLEACTLAADYGAEYDGYIEHFEASLTEYDVNPFEASEDEKLKYLLYPDWKADEEWLTYSRNDRLQGLDDLSEAGWRVVRDVLSESTPVDALIHRNTRDTLRKYEQVGLLDTTVPNRNPTQRKIELTDETRAVYDRIDDYTRTFYKLAQQSDEAETRAIGFVMTTYRQRLTSSVYAISQSLQNRLEKLRGQRAVLRGKQRAANREAADQANQSVFDTLSEYELDDIEALDDVSGDLEDADLTEVIPGVTDQGLNLLEQEIEELESFVTDLRRIDEDPKVSQLIEDLRVLDHEGHNRVIIFTQYTDTMDFIRESLTSIHQSTVATYSGRGGEMYSANDETWNTVGKERVKREFADDNGQVDILVCTDSASEGLNLQERGALINYDLPWNPMRVEQRIGRIDRIGQHYDEVTILNYSYEDTVETDIYDRLDDRIGLFENVVGEMQPILSGVSRQIRDATLGADTETTEDVVEEADRQISDQIDEQEQADRVDVGESLDAVETLSKADVIDEAKVDAWRSYSHPDIIDVGDTDYEYEPPYSVAGLESVFVGNDTLIEAGVSFIAVEELDLEAADAGYDGEFAFGSQTYQLSTGTTSIQSPTDAPPQTMAHVIGGGDSEIAVTFSAECADEYPSIHYLAPGNPVFNQLVTAFLTTVDDQTRFETCVESRSGTRSLPIVSAWCRNDSFVRLTDDGGVTDGGPTSALADWCNAFLDNRQASSDPK